MSETPNEMIMFIAVIILCSLANIIISLYEWDVPGMILSFITFVSAIIYGALRL